MKERPAGFFFWARGGATACLIFFPLIYKWSFKIEIFDDFRGRLLRFDLLVIADALSCQITRLKSFVIVIFKIKNESNGCSSSNPDQLDAVN